MPEAVIVATSRSPIGRAHKGSLVSVRPDDMAATIILDVLSKVPSLDPTTVEDIMHRAAPSRRCAGLQRRPCGGGARRHRGARPDGEPVLLVQPAEHPHRRPRDQG